MIREFGLEYDLVEDIIQAQNATHDHLTKTQKVYQLYIVNDWIAFCDGYEGCQIIKDYVKKYKQSSYIVLLKSEIPDGFDLPDNAPGNIAAREVHQWPISRDILKTILVKVGLVVQADSH